MNISIIKPEEFLTNNWAGGITKQLYIHPENSELSKRNFNFRLSIALVEIDKSIFTPFEGFNRKLMILDGQINLSHNNSHTKKINQFEVEEFDGSWNTQSEGKCTDFNLICDNNYLSELNHCKINKNETISLSVKENTQFIFIYVLNGNIILNDYNILENNLIKIESPINSKFEIYGTLNSNIIISNLINSQA